MGGQTGRKHIPQLCSTSLRRVVASAIFSIIAGGLSTAFFFSYIRVKWAALQLGPFTSLKEHKDPCQAAWRQRLHDHLHGVVLIVNYNFAEHAKGSASLLRALYSPFFDKMVFVAPTALPELGIEARSSSFVVGSKWYWSYAALQRIVRENPEAEGFLWMSDDVALNYWHLIRADKAKVWVRRYRGRNFPFNTKIKTNFDDDWAGEREHRISAWKVFQQMSEPFKREFQRSMAPHRNMYPKRVVDLLYLPRNHSHILAEELIPLFLRHRVWWEIAVPMMLFSLQHPLGYDGVLDDMEYRWEHRGEDKEEYDPAKFWSRDISGLHPWKLSALQSRVRYLKAIGKMDPCVVGLRDLVHNSSSSET